MRDTGIWKNRPTRKAKDYAQQLFFNLEARGREGGRGIVKEAGQVEINKYS